MFCFSVLLYVLDTSLFLSLHVSIFLMIVRGELKGQAQQTCAHPDYV